MESVEAVGPSGEIVVFRRALGQLPYSYRHSRFQDPAFAASQLAVTAATFRLAPDAGAGARAEALLAKRKKSQPLSSPSAGCVFRNPVGGAGEPLRGGADRQVGP